MRQNKLRSKVAREGKDGGGCAKSRSAEAITHACEAQEEDASNETTTSYNVGKRSVSM